MKKLALIATIAFGMAATSCDSYMDINENPNSPTKSDLSADMILPAAEMNIASSYGNFLRTVGGYYAQHYVQSFGTSNYLDFSQFTMSATRSEGTWTQIYQRGLQNLKTVDEMATESEDWGTHLAVTVLRAFAFQTLVDCYDAVPYTEALDLDIVTPKFDEGQVVYDGIIAELDEALAKVTGLETVSKNFLYSSAEDWIKFANALKLRILMRESGVKEVTAQLDALVAANNFPTEDVQYAGIWSNVSGQANPYYQEEFASYFGSTQVNVVANIAIIGTMQQKDAAGDVVYEDPRLAKFFEKNSAGEFTGGISGTNFSTSNTYKAAYWCRPVMAYDTPLDLITVFETEFFLSEYYAKKGDAANAKTHYEAAIQASFDKAGVNGAAACIARFPYDQSKYQEVIGIAKWVALAGVNNFEAWCEMRRLDYPAFGTVSGLDMYNKQDDSSYKPELYVPGTLYTPIDVFNEVGDNKLLERFPLPGVSTSRNTNAPKYDENNKFSYTKPVFWGK